MYIISNSSKKSRIKRKIVAICEIETYTKKLNNKSENVNVSPFTFFYISKLFKINKLMDVR